MKRKDCRSALKVDFSQNSTLKETLLAELMQRPDAPTDMKEDVPMKTTIKYSTRVLVLALISVLLLSALALAAVKTMSLGPFMAYDLDENSHYDPNDVQDSRTILDDTTAPKSVAGELRETEWGQYMDYPTYEDVKPHLNVMLNPALPTALPDGYALNRVTLMLDDDGNPFSDLKYLTVYYCKQDVSVEMRVQLMDEETAFEISGPGPDDLTEVTINGHSGIVEGGNKQNLLDGSMLNLLIDDVLYSFSSDDPGLTMDNLIKIAESIQG